jgi:hypothetical protein
MTAAARYVKHFSQVRACETESKMLPEASYNSTVTRRGRVSGWTDETSCDIS